MKNKIRESVDETTDVEQRCIVNFVFGVLGEETEKGKCYLLNVGVQPLICCWFLQRLLWPTKLLYENVLFVCTDAALYMCKAMAAGFVS